MLTLPRRYAKVKVNQSVVNKVSIDAPGVANFSAYKIVTAQIFEIKENNEFEWVCDLLENTLNNTFTLQPGKYKVVYRQKDLKSTSYTKQKDFNVYSNKTVTINL